MKIGIDVDGILSDFITSFVKVLNKLFPQLSLPADFQPTDWGWHNISPPLDDKMMGRAWDSVRNTPNFWEECSPTSDIVSMASFFHEHADYDHEIYFITARIETAGRSARHQTENWLKEHLGNPKQTVNVLVVHSGMDKVDVQHALNIHASIDDHTPTVVNAKSGLRNHKAYLLDKPWNQDGRNYGLRIVKSLHEFFEDIHK